MKVKRHGGSVSVAWWCYCCAEAHPFLKPCKSLKKRHWYARVSRQS